MSDLGKVKEKDTYEEVDENDDQVSSGIFFLFCFLSFFNLWHSLHMFLDTMEPRAENKKN